MYLTIDTGISFADSSLISFNFDCEKRQLITNLKAWNEQIVKILFNDVLYFLSRSGDVIEDLYQVTEDSLILLEAIRREYVKEPKDHPYKLLVIKDIADTEVLQVVCSKFVINML